MTIGLDHGVISMTNQAILVFRQKKGLCAGFSHENQFKMEENYAWGGSFTNPKN